ncbi:MAG: DUF982 domain-containing protein [Brucellaceae bacterium]|jgi:hypothetical protein|nr:DUF982 domain-containing protein [Brucellaceae bacterium]
MNRVWSFSIVAEPEKGRVIKISDWSDLSMFLLCHWPVKYGAAYTLAVCSLSQDFYKKSNIETIIRLFIAALKEAEIPYKFEMAALAHGHSDVSLPAAFAEQLPAASL